jgi:dihydroorotate dehydrogenase electron transfer subunit
LSRNREILERLLEDRLKLATVSGVLTTRPALIEWVDRNAPEIEIITTKSYQVHPNAGNREPILVEPQAGCFANAVGLKNPGLRQGLRELQELRRRRTLRSLLNVSVSANCIEDFLTLTREFSRVADILELNFSCPHAADGYGSSIGSNARTVAEYVKAIRRETSVPLFPKLTPNTADIGEIARAAIRSGADGLSAINTVGPELFREPLGGKPVLSNPNGGRGGKSGEWIKETARRKVAEIRRAVGKGVPIIGIGGVSSAEDVRNMRRAGASVVGLGSVFARIPRQELIPLYLAALRRDCLKNTDSAAAFLSSERLMEYRGMGIRKVRSFGETLRAFTLDGSLQAGAGQYAFLFLPGVGEKPFSVAACDPAVFLVRRRGPFTRALFELRAGRRILVRGPYGAPAPGSEKATACIVAGGTGIAAAAPLARELTREKKELILFYGFSRREEAGVPAALGMSCEQIGVFDAGRPARVLAALPGRLGSSGAGQCSFYNVGPEGFLARAAQAEIELGAAPPEILLSLETPSHCGVGLCGSCECGGRLLCKEGTFVSLQFLISSGAVLPGLQQQAREAERAVADG